MHSATEARPVRILLVEDNPGDADLTVEAFRDSQIPHELSLTWNGDEALAYLRKQGAFARVERPDLILLDLNLPRKDGREVLAEIKQDPGLREIPVIVLSTSHSERDVREAYNLHANSYIVKPVDLEQFWSVVRVVEQFWLGLASLPSGWVTGAPAAAVPLSPPAPLERAGFPAATPLPMPEGLAQILLVEDNPGDAYLIQEYLKAGGGTELGVEVVETLAAARERLMRNGIDLILLDLSLPDSIGLETFLQLFAQAPDVPIVVLSGLADEAVATRAVQAGAQDYLVKGDVDERLILRTLRYAYERAHTQRQLRTAQKMEAIGRLAGGVAHDFNNMLAVILGYSDMLLAQVEPGSLAQTELRELKAAGQRAATLTRQLLAFGRKQMISPRLLRLDELVNGIFGLLQQLLPPEIELDLRFAPHAGWVRADPSQLEQALVNLVMNARDAIGAKGRIEITTSFVEVDELLARGYPGVAPGPFELLSVSDTGAGIPEDLWSLVFEPFFTTKAPGQGSGLGLASVYGTTRQNGGFVALESEVGRGTTFRLYLPRAERCPAEAVPAREPAAQRSRATVLVLDADAQLRRLIAEILGSTGYTLLLAGDGDEAMQLVQAHSGPVDLLLADRDLSGSDRFAAVLARRQYSSELKVLLMSAYVAEAPGAAAETVPGMLVVRKPFSPAHLKERVAKALA